MNDDGCAPPQAASSISVVVATCQGERYLPALFESLLRQENQPAEYIVSDDHSSDRTLEITRSFAERSAVPVICLQNPVRLGYAENFLQGSRQANSRFIAFCDQDDEWEPSKIRRVTEELTADSNLGFLSHTASLIDAEGRPIGRFDQGIERSLTVHGSAIEPWRTYFGFSIVVRKDLLFALPAEERGPDFNDAARMAAHDQWACFMAQTFTRVRLLADSLVRYRQHDMNLFAADGSASDRGIRPFAGTLAAHVQCARWRSALLMRMSGRPLAPHLISTDGSNPLASAADRWARISRMEGARLVVHSSSSRATRCIALARGLWSGAYRQYAGRGLRLRSIGRDLRWVVS